jgi:hypothetical protein
VLDDAVKLHSDFKNISKVRGKKFLHWYVEEYEDDLLTEMNDEYPTKRSEHFVNDEAIKKLYY